MSALAEALHLTRAMIDIAHAGDWAELGRLLEQRARLLTPDLHRHTDAPQLLPALEAAQLELAQIVASAREESRQVLLASQRAQAAASRYLEVAQSQAGDSP
jgi:recombinational DNA repair ATPase RecF